MASGKWRVASGKKWGVKGGGKAHLHGALDMICCIPRSPTTAGLPATLPRCNLFLVHRESPVRIVMRVLGHQSDPMEFLQNAVMNE